MAKTPTNNEIVLVNTPINENVDNTRVTNRNNISQYFSVTPLAHIAHLSPAYALFS